MHSAQMNAMCKRRVQIERMDQSTGHTYSTGINSSQGYTGAHSTSEQIERRVCTTGRKVRHARYIPHKKTDRKQIAGTKAQGKEHNVRVYNVQDGQHAEADKAQASATCRKGQRG